MGVSYNPKIVTNGLTFCLDAANIKSYSGTGSTMNDLSPSGLSCSILNSPTFSSGSFSLNGTSQYFTVADNEVFNFGASSFTVEIAVKFNDLVTFRTLWGQSNSTDFAPFLIFKYADRLSFWASTTATSWDVLNDALQIPNSLISTTSWLVISATRSGSVWKSYLNGQNIATLNLGSTATLYNSSNILQICSRTSAIEYLSGNFAFNRVYNRALSDQEIVQNFNAVRGRYGI